MVPAAAHPGRSRTVTVRDGRALGATEWGEPGGPAILYLHGAVGSPLSGCPALGAALDTLGLHYVMVDRPGFGRSDPRPDRTVLDFADDVEDLADALGLGRFAVVGVSAGGPYAAACAHRLADRVSATAIVSGLGPIARADALRGMPLPQRLALLTLARHPNAAGTLGALATRAVHRHPGLFACVPADEAARAHARESFLVATRGGVRGMIEDFLVSTGPWGFEPEAVRGEVHLWHGTRDSIVPLEHALQLAIALPRCRAAFDPDEGHFFFRKRMVEILGALTGREALTPPAGRPALRLARATGASPRPAGSCRPRVARRARTARSTSWSGRRA